MPIDTSRIYRLRLELIAITRQYAVLGDPGRPIILSPSPNEKANWRLLPFEGVPDLYRIMYDSPNPGLPVLWEVPEQPQRNAPVNITPDMGQKGWYIRLVEGQKDIVTISPDIQSVGVDWLAGSNQDGAVAFMGFLPNDPSVQPKPYWFLEPVDG